MQTLTKTSQREKQLLPDGIPRYIRCYDNGGETYDRYTVIYTKKPLGRDHRGDTVFLYVGMSEDPFHPMGFGQHGELAIQHTRGSHLGKKISFTQLPADCQQLVLSDYKELWNI